MTSRGVQKEVSLRDSWVHSPRDRGSRELARDDFARPRTQPVGYNLKASEPANTGEARETLDRAQKRLQDLAKALSQSCFNFRSAPPRRGGNLFHQSCDALRDVPDVMSL